MRFTRLVAATVLALGCSAFEASAQEVKFTGFAGGGVTSDLNNQRYPTLGGGVLVEPGVPWLSIGGQGETFFQWPYFAGRGAVFVQGNPLPKSTVRPFVLAGRAFGEDSGPLMIGGGVEFRPAEAHRAGVRLVVEDYVRKSPYLRETSHQVAFKVAVLF